MRLRARHTGAAQLADAATLEEWASAWDDPADITTWRLLDAAGRVIATAHVPGY